ncbi:MAG TPA: hypothetical protein VF438_02275 [Candidatus Paceibacterota bacterium]
MKQYASEIGLAVIVIVIAALFWNPYWMPMGAVYVALICFGLVLGSYVVFIWRERGGDEREVLIRQVAGRIAYISAFSILALGIIWQALMNTTVDPWLVAAFILSVMAKTAGYIYGKDKY